MAEDTKDFASKTLGLAGLVDYQADAVVSKTILKKTPGSITLFAFDKGEVFSEHSVPFDAMIHVIDGEAEVTLTGKKHDLKGGDALIMPANAPHGLKAVRRFKMALTLFKAG